MEEAIEANPNQEFAQLRFQLTLSDELAPNKKEIHQKLMAAIEADSMLLRLCVWLFCGVIFV
jgi:hypothetical protein